MIFIQEEDKENIHPNVMHNKKSVQFSDKLKRYNNDTLTFSSDNSCQGTGSKQSNNQQKILIKNQSTSQQSNHKPHQPEVSHFDINQLHHISKQISLKDVSKVYTSREAFLKSKAKKQWVKSIMQPSKAELKLLQRIQGMLEKQSFKPTYSTIKGFKKQCYSNTMNTDEKLNSEGMSMFKQSVQHSKAKSQEQSNKSTLSDLINFSRLSGISSKTLQKYLLCLEKENLKELQKSQKVSEFSLIDTQRSKQAKNQQIQQQKNKPHDKPDKISQIENKHIIEIYSLIKGKQKNTIDSTNIDADKMLEQIKDYIVKTLGKAPKQQDSTCLLQD